MQAHVHYRHSINVPACIRIWFVPLSLKKKDAIYSCVCVCKLEKKGHNTNMFLI